jgi:hypothetical protein
LLLAVHSRLTVALPAVADRPVGAAGTEVEVEVEVEEFLIAATPAPEPQPASIGGQPARMNRHAAIGCGRCTNI